MHHIFHENGWRAKNQNWILLLIYLTLRWFRVAQIVRLNLCILNLSRSSFTLISPRTWVFRRPRYSSNVVPTLNIIFYKLVARRLNQRRAWVVYRESKRYPTRVTLESNVELHLKSRAKCRHWSTEFDRTTAQPLSHALAHDATISLFVLSIQFACSFIHSFFQSSLFSFFHSLVLSIMCLCFYLFFVCRLSINMMKAATLILPLVFELVLYRTAAASCPQKCSCKDTAMHCIIDDLRYLKTFGDHNITRL